MRFVIPFVDVLLIILQFLEWTVFVWVIILWILFFASQSSVRWRYRGFYNLLNQLNDIFSRMTHPFLRPFRRLLRRIDTAGIDWSPLLLLLVIYLIRRLLIAAILAPTG
jgi:uncharacterized protein YggT (Ycf19 family)